MPNAGVGSLDCFEQLYASRTWEYYRPVLAHVVANSSPGPILDIGAGTGLFVEAAARWGLDCQGIEGSQDAVEIGRSRYRGLRLDRQYLSEPLPFPDESFQTVLLHQVMAHLEPDLARNVLRETLRVLRRGGRIFIFSPARLDKALARNDPNTWMRLYAPGEMRALLVAAGFQDVIPLDSPRELLGKNPLARAAMRMAFRLTRWDQLSATANCQATKP